MTNPARPLRPRDRNRPPWTGAERRGSTLSADLRSRSTPVGAHDLIIAATAVFRDDRVATRDLRSLPRIRGLDVLHW